MSYLPRGLSDWLADNILRVQAHRNIKENPYFRRLFHQSECSLWDHSVQNEDLVVTKARAAVILSNVIGATKILTTPEYTTYALWGAWAVSWTVARLWASRTEKRAGIGAELIFRALLGAGGILLFAFPSSDRRFGQIQLWNFGDALNWILVVMAATGLLFTWWARIHLGRLWSDLIVKKAGHQVVDTGPYRLVRHPIYAGLIVAAFATATEKGTSFAILGAAIMTLAFYTKARLEERFLRAELGEHAYDIYAGKTRCWCRS